MSKIGENTAGRYTSTDDFVHQNDLEQEAIECFGEDWESGDDVDQILELIEFLGAKHWNVNFIEGLRSDTDLEVSFNSSSLKLEEVLEEIKEIKTLMWACSGDAWDNQLKTSSECIMLEDIQSTDEDFIEYNGWANRLEKLIQKLEN